jgi:serine protease Do
MPTKIINKRALPRLLCVLAAFLVLLPTSSGAGARGAAPTPPTAPTAHPAQPPVPPEPPAPARGWLGVLLSDEEGEGVMVTGVKENSPAQKAGLQEGDRILELDGQKIARSQDVRRAMRALEAGDAVQIKIQRKSQEKTLKATLEEPPEDSFLGGGARWLGEEAPGGFSLGMMGMSRNYLGVRVLALTEDLRAYFKAPRGRGILVSRVEEDTPAAKAGLRAGDVIIAVDGKGISDQSDIASALGDHQPGDKVQVRIVRDGSERTVDVEIAERQGPRQHGGIFTPEGDEMDLDGGQGISQEAQDAIRQAVERAREAYRRALRNLPKAQAQISAALQEKELSQRQIKDLELQIEDAVRQAREAVRRATESMKDLSI